MTAISRRGQRAWAKSFRGSSASLTNAPAPAKRGSAEASPVRRAKVFTLLSSSRRAVTCSNLGQLVERPGAHRAAGFPFQVCIFVGFSGAAILVLGFMSEKRFFTLDAMRGIAALSVVSHAFRHRPDGNGDAAFAMPNSYLGVDFFFMLSGFVLARAYERQAEDLASPGGASWNCASSVFTPCSRLAFCWARQMRRADRVPHPACARAGVDAAVGLAHEQLMLPDFRSGYMLFPVNMPAWTLFFELVDQRPVRGGCCSACGRPVWRPLRLGWRAFIFGARF